MGYVQPLPPDRRRAEGAYELGRLAAELAVHGDGMPRLLYASFLAPGSAALTIASVTE